MKQLSRRDFLRGAAASGLTVAAAGVLGMGNVFAEETTYTPGTYSASAQGAMSEVTVTMTFDEKSITDVVIDASGETENLGGAAAEVLVESIMKNQSAEIDAVSGSTLTSSAVTKAAAKCIKQAKGEIPVEVINEKASTEEAGAKSWLGSAPEVKEVSETWDTDILIVGAGNAGMLAAAYAADKKLNFRVVEQNPVVCDTRSWYGIANSAEALAAGKEIDKQRAMTELTRYASGKIDQSLVKVWLNESADMHEFVKGIMADAGFEVYFEEDTGIDEDGTNYYHAPIQHNYVYSADPSDWNQKPRNVIFQEYIEERGYSVDFEHSLVELVKDGDKVVGAIVENAAGDYIQINAAKGVLLTTGGYEGNTEMMEALSPMAVACTTANSYYGTNKGQGIKAALWAGADMDKESAPMLFDRGAVAPGVDAGYAVDENGNKAFPGTIGQWNPGTQPFMKVNRDGVRFANEGGPYNDIVFGASNQKGGVYCQVYDANFKEDWQKFHTLGCSSLTRAMPDAMAEQMEQNVEAGIIMKADTLEELADKLGFEGEAKENFLAQCDRYNTIYDNGVDDEFYKSAHYLSELRTAPFYGVWLGASLLCTGDGVKINAKAQVLNEKKEVIEGLYCAGNAAGNFFANNYPELFPGLACGRTMTIARKAIRVMSGEEA